MATILEQINKINSVWEERLRLVIKPKPRYVPNFIWRRLISMILEQQYQRLTR
jgi:hypothetical protein